jgi:hypothetical protein
LEGFLVEAVVLKAGFEVCELGFFVAGYVGHGGWWVVDDFVVVGEVGWCCCAESFCCRGDCLLRCEKKELISGQLSSFENKVKIKINTRLPQSRKDC